MKKLIHLIAMLGIGSFALFGLPGCEQEGPVEEGVEEIDEGVEEIGEGVEEAGEEVEDDIEEATDNE